MGRGSCIVTWGAYRLSVDPMPNLPRMGIMEYDVDSPCSNRDRGEMSVS